MASPPDAGTHADDTTEPTPAGGAEPATFETGAPSVLARVVGFVAILAAGGAGGFIGWAITDLQCSGECTVQTGLGGLGGAIFGAVGVAIVVVLALRAMAEWRTIQARNPDAGRAPARTADGGRRPDLRVR